jgi:betaine lipid synthase
MARLFLNRPSGDTHAERMESFYRPQAKSYDQLREGFLHGRDLLMRECARLAPAGGVWVDLGGGTARNLLAMRAHRRLDTFERIYLVDISPAMCAVARAALAREGIGNAEVVCADAGAFAPPEKASLVTFSYSLSMMPDFHRAIDQALSYLAPDGRLGIADFFVPGRDEERRTMGYAARWLWRAWFDLDRIEVGPERRAYLEHKLGALFDCDARAPISWAPFVQVPYYVSVKAPRASPARPRFHYRGGARASWRFGKTFIYNISWEDPELDKRHLGVGEGARVLTLTSGGCNSLEWLLEGAEQVTTTDINACQNFLLELKCAAVAQLEAEDVWKLLGEGRHERIRQLFERELRWHLSPPARDFWRERLHYFDDGLYNHGGTGRGTGLVRKGVRLLAGKNQSIIDRFLAARSIEEQQELWRSRVRPLLVGSGLLGALCNPVTLWFCIGVPRNQWLQVIKGRSAEEYFDAVGEGLFSSGLVGDNYFWRWFFTGEFVRGCCPRYLLRENLAKLKDGRLSRLQVRHGTFLAAAREGRHDRLILGDHLDWFGPRRVEAVVDELGRALHPQARLSFLTSSPDPSHAAHFRSRGFQVDKRASMKPYMDRANTYEGYYVVTPG